MLNPHLLCISKNKKSEVKPSIRSGYRQIKIEWLQTDFLGLGVDKEAAVMWERFLKNILNVADSKFSTAKHLHDVWRGMKIAMTRLD